MHDIHFLFEIQGQLTNSLLIADKGYLSQERQEQLKEDNKLLLYTPKPKNQRLEEGPRRIPLFDRLRKQVERTYAQLKDQLLIERNYAKSFLGYKTRILFKVTALTLVQHLNKFVLHPDINLIKQPIY